MRWVGFIGAICRLLLLANTARSNNATKSTFMTIEHDGKVDKFVNLTHVKILKNRAHSDTRDLVVLQTLQAAAGVYLNKERGKSAGLEKTVFITVVAYNSKENISHYKIYFRNFLCFVQHYDIDLIVYILHHNLPDVQEEIRILEDLGVKVLTYPDEKFWSLIEEKTHRITYGKAFADYDSETPSFHNYGALLMLVPQLEVLDLGYNVIYFDVDIGLVQDPVPYITRGDADFTVSIEQRYCPEEYPSSRRFTQNWEVQEPNTGVMHVRATSQGVSMYRKWLRRIVQTNVRNDQLAFHRDGRIVQMDTVSNHLVYGEHNFTSTFTPSCNWNYQNTTPTVRASPTASTYCFLSEMMFQNGMNSLQCSLKPAYRDDWHVEMVRQVPEVQVGEKSLRLPVSVHANYCNAKTHELNVRGLWLYNENWVDGSNGTLGRFNAAASPAEGEKNLSRIGCKAYNASNVYFAQKNFTMEMERIENYRLDLLKIVMVNGTLLKRFGGEEVYLISVDLKRQLVPDGETFLNMGYNWDDVKSVPAAVAFMIPEGNPLKSTKKKTNGKRITGK